MAAIHAHFRIHTGKARDVDGQLVYFENDGLTGEVFMKFGAEGTTPLGEEIDLLWDKETVCSVEFVA